jgi:hypothetical protein
VPRCIAGNFNQRHPLIWGIGVKRKFSASRTAFLRKL